MENDHTKECFRNWQTGESQWSSWHANADVSDFNFMSIEILTLSDAPLREKRWGRKMSFIFDKLFAVEKEKICNV